ncbi:hypothetical protein P3X46_012535 [Hevea brasiliensis]|uniref:SMP domain-containing protein n=1 Tax=Hevea brasiliensis TaxID=3981 RepID=A0ABQ9MAI0_HEVBR|nr:uncharacterized protein LOC110645744 [Hevea brasiliensis]KAJ9177301.1 hypothetical protein P3X46_012535 [Hevea brasiliensis]
MNAQARREVVTKNAQGDVEKKVETIDYRSSAGQGAEIRNVQVVHQSHPKENLNTSGGVLSNAAASVASTLESAKDAITKN